MSGFDTFQSADDLWLPQTTPDGQVFYYNQRTQESSWTIPEPEDRASMGTADTAGQDVVGKCLLFSLFMLDSSREAFRRMHA